MGLGERLGFLVFLKLLTTPSGHTPNVPWLKYLRPQTFMIEIMSIHMRVQHIRIRIYIYIYMLVYSYIRIHIPHASGHLVCTRVYIHTYELLSKLLVSPLIILIVLPYIIPYITTL